MKKLCIVLDAGTNMAPLQCTIRGDTSLAPAVTLSLEAPTSWYDDGLDLVFSPSLALSFAA